MKRFTTLHINEAQAFDQGLNLSRLYIDANNYALIAEANQQVWPFARRIQPMFYGEYASHGYHNILGVAVKTTNYRRQIRGQHEHNLCRPHRLWRFEDTMFPLNHSGEYHMMGKAIAKVGAATTTAARFKAYAEAHALVTKSWRPSTNRTNRTILFNVFRTFRSYKRIPNDAPVRKVRELARSSPLPWKNEAWWLNSPHSVLHGAKVSKKFPELLAYYQSPEKFERDIMTPIKAGRYLAQFFSHVLDEGQIRRWATVFANECASAKLFFTDLCTAEAGNLNDVVQQWLNIYETGPSSCMKGKSAVKVYVYPDNTLRLAYFTNDNQPKSANNYAIARCIVRDDDKQWVRIYPEDGGTLWNGMKNALEAKDYTHGNINDVKGQLIESHGRIVCPYLDYGDGGDQSISVHAWGGGNYITFGGGEMDACNTNGYANDNRPECSCCGEHCDEDDMRYDDSGDAICESCFDEHYVEAIGRYGDEIAIHQDCAIYVESQDTYYHERWLSNNNIYVAECGRREGDYFHSDDLVSTPDGLCYADDATMLDVETSDGHEYVVDGDEAQTHDGRTIVECESVSIEWWDGETYILHTNDDPEDYLPENPNEDAMSPNTYPNATTVESIYA